MTPELKKSILAFEDFLNEPPQYEDKRMVRDYRHAAYGRWSELRDKITAALSPPEPTEALVQAVADEIEVESLRFGFLRPDVCRAYALAALRAMPLQDGSTS